MQSLRRQVKNVAYNYTDGQKKVREATSNSPWGPTTTQMMEIADYMRNPVAFNEMMSIVWKRLNDSGKNWRHVYKSLVLLDFLIKCGNDKVASLCRENLFAIETLRDFQHVEEGRDQGINVREKSRQVVSILRGDVPIPGAQQTSASASASHEGMTMDNIPPGELGDEEQQLQLALRLSLMEKQASENHDQEYEIHLQEALEMSRRESEQAKRNLSASSPMTFPTAPPVSKPPTTQSAVDDLLSLGDSAFLPQASSSVSWQNTGLNDPWAHEEVKQDNTENYGVTADPWNSTNPTSFNDMVSGVWDAPLPSVAPAYDNTMNQSTFLSTHNGFDPDPFATSTSTYTSQVNEQHSYNEVSQSAQSFLGVNSTNVNDLVELDNLSSTNPFLAVQKKNPSLNEMRNGQVFPTPPLSPYPSTIPSTVVNQLPNNSNYNPFASQF